MPDLFADTSGLGCLIDPSQNFHVLATKIYYSIRDRGDKMITTNYVITELVALLSSPLRVPRPQVIQIINGFRQSPFVEIVHIDVELSEKAWHLLEERPDKQWSLVDCASFVLLEQRGLREALTTDRHFIQAGFVRLLGNVQTAGSS